MLEVRSPLQWGILRFCPASEQNIVACKILACCREKHFRRTALVGFVLAEPCECRTGAVLEEPFASGQCHTNGKAHSDHAKCFFAIFGCENVHWGSCNFISVLLMVQEALGWTFPWLQMTSNQGLTW